MGDPSGPLVELADEPGGAGTSLFVLTPQGTFSFAVVTAVLDELGLNIVDARLVMLPDNKSMSTYVILEENGRDVVDDRRLGEIRRRLLAALGVDEPSRIEVTRRAPRQVRMFDTPVHVTFNTDARERHTVMELVAGDRPGLLSDVAKVLRSMGVHVRTAKIMTVGERAEDVFFITDDNQQPLESAACDALKATLTDALQAAA